MGMKALEFAQALIDNRHRASFPDERFTATMALPAEVRVEIGMPAEMEAVEATLITEKYYPLWVVVMSAEVVVGGIRRYWCVQHKFSGCSVFCVLLALGNLADSAHLDLSKLKSEGCVHDLRAEVERLKAERDAALDRIQALDRELERHRHSETIESDFICPDSVQLTVALAEVERLTSDKRRCHAMLQTVMASFSGSDDDIAFDWLEIEKELSDGCEPGACTALCDSEMAWLRTALLDIAEAIGLDYTDEPAERIRAGVVSRIEQDEKRDAKMVIELASARAEVERLRAEVEMLRGELVAVETAVGIQNVLEQGIAQGRAQMQSEVERLTTKKRMEVVEKLDLLIYDVDSAWSRTDHRGFDAERTLSQIASRLKAILACVKEGWLKANGVEPS